MRRSWVVLLGTSLAAATAMADPSPAIDKALATKLTRGGWKDAAILLEQPLTVIGATKKKARHVLVVGAKGAIVDAGVAPSAGAESASLDTSLTLPDLTAVTLTYVTPRGDGSDQTSWVWLVRPDGTVACKIEGSSKTDTGTACGSGGWSVVSLRAAGSQDKPVVEVTTEHTGTWSVRGDDGTCRTRSPVRSGPIVTQYVLRPRGACRRQAAGR